MWRELWFWRSHFTQQLLEKWWTTNTIYKNSGFPLLSKQGWEHAFSTWNYPKYFTFWFWMLYFKRLFIIISTRSHEQPIPGAWCGLCLLWHFWHDGFCNGLLTYCYVWILWKCSLWRQWFLCSILFSSVPVSTVQSLYLPETFKSCGSREGSMMSGDIFSLLTLGRLWLKYNVAWSVKCGIVMPLYLSLLWGISILKVVAGNIDV